jgi:hypothetical protein
MILFLDALRSKNVAVQQRERSCRVTMMIVSKHSSQALTAQNVSVGGCLHELRYDKLVVQPLVVPFPAIMLNLLTDGAAKRPFAQENQSIQALGFDASNEPFRKSVQGSDWNR